MKKNEFFLTAPSFFWLSIFFVVPLILIVLISFRSSDSYGNLLPRWTAEAYGILGNENLYPLIARTLLLSLYTTAICLILAIPTAYAMARMSGKNQNIFLLLLIVPFWINFLIRIYAWKVLLHPEGLIKQLLVALGVVNQNASLLYTEGAVLLVLVYTYLPFAILPLYSSAEKFDFSLLDAARDLGANSLRAIISVFLPGIRMGIFSAVLVVFIPALGSFIIPEIVGGTNSQMLGNKIAQYVFIDRNLPRAGALSGVLILLILLPSLLSIKKREIVR